MRIKKRIRRHAGLIIAGVGALVMLPLVSIMSLLDELMEMTGPDGDGAGPLFAMAVTTGLVMAGIVIELINPFGHNKRKNEDRTSECM